MEMLRIKKDVHWTDCLGQRVILDMDRGKYFAFAGVAKDIWDLLAECSDRKLIAETLAEKYGITIQTAVADVDAFMESLARSDLLEFSLFGDPFDSPNMGLVETPRENLEERHEPCVAAKSPRAAQPYLGFIEAYGMLAAIDAGLRVFGFHKMCKYLSSAYRRVQATKSDLKSAKEVAKVALSAFRWYRPGAACMHRALVTFWFLRRKGIPIHLCVGITAYPFSSHSWVELEGQVINDSQGLKDRYVVIARIS